MRLRTNSGSLGTWRRLAAALAFVALLTPVLPAQSAHCDVSRDADANVVVAHGEHAELIAPADHVHDAAAAGESMRNSGVARSDVGPAGTPSRHCDGTAGMTHCASHCIGVFTRSAPTMMLEAGGSASPITPSAWMLHGVVSATDTPPPRA